MVRIDEDLYGRIEAHKRDDETFSEAIERLLASPSLLSIAGLLDEAEAEEFEAAIDAAEADFDAELDEIVDEFETTGDSRE